MSDQSNITPDTRVFGMTIKELFAVGAFLFAVFSAYTQITDNTKDIAAQKTFTQASIERIETQHNADSLFVIAKFESLRTGQTSAIADLGILQNEITHLSDAISKLNGVMDRAFPYKGSGTVLQNGR